MRWRSLLFVPGDDSVRISKAARGNADAVILDLEDGVPEDRKCDARAALGEAARNIAAHGKAVIIRIDNRNAAADLAAAALCSADAIMIPKVENTGRLDEIVRLLRGHQANGGVKSTSTTALLPLIETPAAVPVLHDLAAHPQTIGLAFGSEDFSLALGVEPSPECLDLPCKLLSLAAAGAGKMALAVPFSLAAYRDLGGFEAAAAAARKFGATGGLCVHPGQVDTLNRCFLPPTEALDAARAIVAAWNAPDRGGRGVITVAGQMIDLPVFLRAERLLTSIR
tara:strand:- start:709 stop:1554 length:846 start_codon:yes stop_codon:yes gene_type:complete